MLSLFLKVFLIIKTDLYEILVPKEGKYFKIKLIV